jgi:hypothetical protein
VTELFLKNGAEWLKADFHLHTKTDKQFKYAGDETFYTSDYVEALENTGVRIGVITNHNTFNCEEFKGI